VGESWQRHGHCLAWRMRDCWGARRARLVSLLHRHETHITLLDVLTGPARWNWRARLTLAGSLWLTWLTSGQGCDEWPYPEVSSRGTVTGRWTCVLQVRDGGHSEQRACPLPARPTPKTRYHRLPQASEASHWSIIVLSLRAVPFTRWTARRRKKYIICVLPHLLEILRLHSARGTLKQVAAQRDNCRSDWQKCTGRIKSVPLMTVKKVQAKTHSPISSIPLLSSTEKSQHLSQFGGH
jgi:hypothetical protein